MPYKLILSEAVEETTKAVGENVFFDDLSPDYKVFMFYYPSAMANQDLEAKLRSLGGMTGSNLFVNIGRWDDPNYDKVVKKFNIKKMPVIIVTAIDQLASAPGIFSTAYVRVDNKSLLESPERLLECLQKLFHLFIAGKVSEAMKEYKKDKLNLFASHFMEILKHGFQEIWQFIDKKDISFSWIEGKLELKGSGQ
jgi:hypothetical protein